MSGSDQSCCVVLYASPSDGPRCVGGPEKDAFKEHRPIGAMCRRQLRSRSRGRRRRGGDKPATEAVLKLYTAIKDRNVQVLAFLSSLMTAMGKRIEFVIQPTPLGGMNVGIQWKLDFDHTSVPFGKGFSFYTVHVYQGKAYVRNADTFIEPIVHGMEPFLSRLAAFLGPLLGITVLHQKWAAFFEPIVERVSPIIKHKRTRAFIYSLLTLVTMCTLLTILKRFLF